MIFLVMRLQETGSFHLGDFVNTFRHGSLVMRLPDSEAAQIPTLIFGTVSGTIGVIASLNKQQFLFFEKLQVGKLEASDSCPGHDSGSISAMPSVA